MIRRLQKKFVLIAMLSLLAVMFLVIGSINLLNLYHLDRRADGLLLSITDHDGRFPKFQSQKKPPDHEKGRNAGFTPETQFETRYFVVRADESGRIIHVDTSHIAAVSEEEAGAYGEKVLKAAKTKGYQGYYKYLVTEKENEKLVVFVDCRLQLEGAGTLLAISSAIGAGCFLIVFLLVTIFSKKAIRPVIRSMEKQKQFISDAGHEIKTPLTIISANTEVLELSTGENQWLTSIRNQVERLNKLTQNLLTLSKMEEQEGTLDVTEFCLSDGVSEVLDGFSPIIKAQKKRVEQAVAPAIRVHGNEGMLRQLTAILLDNAIKYSGKEGSIHISLISRGKGSGKGVRLEICNSLEEAIPKADLERFFDRFYRSDASRAHQSGGYGLGLSIAKSIAEAHRGKLTVALRGEKTICFTLILP